ncbi:hypothetical protein LNKW23_43100 [Paralimibaculum aggregatum]|uniref:GP-PDE domain-containing protein n=1 Tax=Paralimibaculum aggregatum TaxID=3036245 RepID=A0ABQ6LSN8_9RHOB|nr:hypothetical protein LNKW23_43100 [Limibaculum sp. NKW23]
MWQGNGFPVLFHDPDLNAVPRRDVTRARALARKDGTDAGEQSETIRYPSCRCRTGAERYGHALLFSDLGE